MARGVNRRQTLAAGLGAWGSVAMTAKAADPLSGQALYVDVRTYAGLGEHRTGTPGDDATTKWLLRALKAAGYEAQAQGFDYPVFELGRADLTAGPRTLEGFPYWTPKTTPPGGITAPLSTSGGSGKIALVVLPTGTGGGLNQPPPASIVAAADSGALAVVAVTQTPLGELAALNRTPQAPPWKVPVLLAAGRDEPALRAVAASGAKVTLRLEGRTVAGRADNVVGRRARPGKHLVLTTPKSGWFHCAGERGSGVAIWLGLARWLAASDHNVTLLAASGHEFDGYGGHRFTESLAPKPADTRLWLAIGANVAAYDFALRDGRPERQPGPQAGRMLACSDPLMNRAARAFAGQPGYETPFDIDQKKPPGEVAHFQELGYAPLIGLVAMHPLHHTRIDLPDVTGPEVLEPVARGLAALIAESTA